MEMKTVEIFRPRIFFSGILLAIITIIFVASPVFPAVTSSEFVNPFNKFMSPSGGVDLFSGNAAFSHTLMELPTRCGGKFDITLNYSSNVFLNARANNDRAPSGWVGLGWRLGYGSIICDHKSTTFHNDDDFSWISPEGVSKLLIKKINDDGSQTFFIEDEPYIKLGHPDYNNDGIYDGWIIMLPNGECLKYGDLNLQGTRNATRWTFSRGSYVGVVHTGNVTPYPYQWDLSQKIVPNCDTINFFYEQKKSPLVGNAKVSGSGCNNTSSTPWSSGAEYTPVLHKFYS
jgi:hypothetical protein